MSEPAAQRIAHQPLRKPDSVLGLAAGSTRIGTYGELARTHREGGPISLKRQRSPGMSISDWDHMPPRRRICQALVGSIPVGVLGRMGIRCMHNIVVTTVPSIAMQSRGMQRVCSALVPVEATEVSVYKTVEFFEHDLLQRAVATVQRIGYRVPLRSVINLHNHDGIRDLSQMEDMVHKIRTGNDILHPGGLPNVKLVRSTRGERVLFDGHHSTMAYIACGRTFLDEIPHLEVYGEGGFVTDQDILAFFGPHSIKIRHRSEDWRHWVVNWQTSEEKQLCGRIQGNMGELFDLLFGRQAWELQGGMTSPRAKHGARRSTSPALPVRLRREGCYRRSRSA